MIGAIIGDIAGSRFEWQNIKTKEFDLLTHKCSFTDDAVMSLAICEALMRSKTNYSDLAEQAVVCMQEIGRPYPGCGYGEEFGRWIYDNDPTPKESMSQNSKVLQCMCRHWISRSNLKPLSSRAIRSLRSRHHHC